MSDEIGFHEKERFDALIEMEIRDAEHAPGTSLMRWKPRIMAAFDAATANAMRDTDRWEVRSIIDILTKSFRRCVRDLGHAGSMASDPEFRNEFSARVKHYESLLGDTVDYRRRERDDVEFAMEVREKLGAFMISDAMPELDRLIAADAGRVAPPAGVEGWHGPLINFLREEARRFDCSPNREDPPVVGTVMRLRKWADQLSAAAAPQVEQQTAGAYDPSIDSYTSIFNSIGDAVVAHGQKHLSISVTSFQAALAKRGFKVVPIAAPSPRAEEAAPTGAIWRHTKSGGLYEVVCGARNEADGVDLTVYRSLKDGCVWARPVHQFMEKFERIATPRAQGENDE